MLPLTPKLSNSNFEAQPVQKNTGYRFRVCLGSSPTRHVARSEIEAGNGTP